MSLAPSLASGSHLFSVRASHVNMPLKCLKTALYHGSEPDMLDQLKFLISHIDIRSFNAFSSLILFQSCQKSCDKSCPYDKEMWVAKTAKILPHFFFFVWLRVIFFLNVTFCIYFKRFKGMYYMSRHPKLCFDVVDNLKTFQVLCNSIFKSLWKLNKYIEIHAMVSK